MLLFRHQHESVVNEYLQTHHSTQKSTTFESTASVSKPDFILSSTNIRDHSNLHDDSLSSLNLVSGMPKEVQKDTFAMLNNYKISTEMDRKLLLGLYEEIDEAPSSIQQTF